MPLRLYTGARGNTTSFLDIRPTPTQMFDGIQFHFEFGVTTVTVCSLSRSRRRWSAAVCPATPAPSISTRAIQSSTSSCW